MSSPTSSHKTWTFKDTFLISTDPTLISLESLNAAFASPELYWATPYSPPVLQTIINNSVCFGVYDTSPVASEAEEHQQQNRLIGFARLVTDFVTLAYLTDVYVLPEYQGLGLGHWLICCVKEWVGELGMLRQFVLVSKEGETEAYYKRMFGVGRMGEDGSGYRMLNAKGPGAVHFDTV